MVSDVKKISSWKSQLLSYSFTVWNISPKAALEKQNYFSINNHVKRPDFFFKKIIEEKAMMIGGI